MRVRVIRDVGGHAVGSYLVVSDETGRMLIREGIAVSAPEPEPRDRMVRSRDVTRKDR